KLVAKAEEDFMNHTYDENLDFDYLNNKKLCSSQEYELKKNQSGEEFAKQFQYLNMTPSESFNNILINVEQSTVHVPTNVYDKSKKILNGVYWSEKMNNQFVENMQNDNTLKWQYFCSSDGFFRVFPGLTWPRKNMEGEGDTDLFDCRMRSWYLQAATCPKNVVILVDTSGSMKGLRMEIARSTIHEIIDTLTDDDHFNIILFSNYSRYVDQCFNGTMMPANSLNKLRLQNLIKEIKTERIANFELALEEAFQLFESETLYRNNELPLCNKAIALITDWVPHNYEWVFEKYNWPNKTVRVFTYLIGREVPDNREIKWMACANKGYFTHISTKSDVNENVQHYIKVMSRPMAIDNYPNLIWTSLYLDHLSTLEMSKGFGFVTSVALPVFDKRNSSGNLLGVVGTDVPIEEIKKLIQPYKLGPNGYAFLINHNGLVLIHNDYRPLHYPADKGESKDSGQLKPNFNNVDLSDVELAVEPEQLLRMREHMLSHNSGSEAMVILKHYEHMRRMSRRKFNVFYQKIEDTDFSLGISLPSEYGRPILQYANKIIAKHWFEGDNIRLAPWSYCKSLASHLKDRERIDALLKIQEDQEFARKDCDAELMEALKHDGFMTAQLIDNWKDNAIRFKDQSFIEKNLNTVRTLYYRKTVEGYYAGDVSKDVGFKLTVSIPLGENISDDTLATMTTPIVVEKQNRKAIAGVTGIRIKYSHFLSYFMNVTKQCDPISNCTAVCSNKTVSCFIIDNHGYILASNLVMHEAGKFLGEVRKELMGDLIMKGYFERLLTDLNSVTWWYGSQQVKGVQSNVPVDCSEPVYDYEDGKFTPMERQAYIIWKKESVCKNKQYRQESITGYRSCHKNFTLYQANMTKFRGVHVGSYKTLNTQIEECARCANHTVCEKEDPKCKFECLKYDKYPII
ncbi:hypothetical protein ACJMK2_016553, partial [Sinanodonta woodiana]